MFKKILIIIAGVVLGSIVIYLIEALGHAVYPPPTDVDLADQDGINQMIAELPVGAFLFVLAAYALGAFIGGLVSVLFSADRTIWAAIGVGIILMLFGVMNLLMIPHPVWFVIISLLLYLPCAFAGGKTAMLLKRYRNE